MNKLISLATMGLVGLVVFLAAVPTLVRLVSAATPLVLVLGIVAAVLRAVWFFTR
ncbi:MAG: hypothetical protein ACYDAE_28080 [Steroidobacteraceae bacterium]